MDDTAFQRYFTRPIQTYQRQYEAVRAVIIDGRSQKEVAEAFGFEYGSIRQLIYAFRRFCEADSEFSVSPFFETLMSVAPPQSRKPLPPPQSLIDSRWCSPVRNHYESEPGRQGSSCSSRFWPRCASIRWYTKRAIPGPR